MRCLVLLVATEAVSAASATSFCAESGWAQVWADEFSGSALDTNSWTVDLKGGDSRVRDAQGTADNVYVENGALVLRSQKMKSGKYNYTSGAVETKGKQSWKGLTRACVRAKLPGGGGGGSGDGIWPAHWMMPDNTVCWPANGEIDIMEMINGDGKTHSTYHWRNTTVGGCGDKCPDGSHCQHDSIGKLTMDATFDSQWHEYAVEYSADHISFAFDGTVFNHLDNSTGTQQSHHFSEFFDVPYYMILNTAVGGPWPGPPSEKTKFPAFHYIDYVRIAQPSKDDNVVI